jgi:hypothetical protein
MFKKMQFIGCKAKRYRIDDYRYMDHLSEYQMRMKVIEQPIIGCVDPSEWHTDRTWKDDIVHMLFKFTKIKGLCNFARKKKVYAILLYIIIDIKRIPNCFKFV